MLASKRFFVLLICLLHALYFAGSCVFQSYLNNDSYEYINQAVNLAQHGSFYAANWNQWPHLPEYFSMRPPLYAILVFLTYYIFNSPYVLLIAQSLLSIFIWLMIRKYILKFIPNINIRKLHSFLIVALIFNPVQLILCNSIFSDILFEFLLTAGFVFLLEFISTKNPRYFLYYILLFTLGLLTKPALVFYGYFNIGLSLYFYFRITRNLILPAAALLMPLVVFAVSLINQNKTGYFHYSTSKVFNLWAYNTTNFLNMEYGNDSGFVYKTYIYRQSASSPDFKSQYEYVDSACAHVLKKNITAYIPYHLQGMFIFFIAPGREYINDYLKSNEPQLSFIKELNVNGWQGVKDYLQSQNIMLMLLNLLVTLWNLLLLAGLIVFVFSKNVPLNIKIIALFIIFYFAGVSSLALGTARYKAAIYPILLFCNSYLLGSRFLKSTAI